jgi:hypothetical protein
VAKKRSKAKRAGPARQEPAAGEALFGWREPQVRAVCRPSAAYRFLADLKGEKQPNLSPTGRYLYLGPIPNRPGYCAAIELATGRWITENHPEDFEELAADEARDGRLGAEG